MGFLTEQQNGSLEIEHMILHVVRDGPFNPELTRDVEHSDFFIERIRNTDAASVYSFEPTSMVKATIGQVVRGELAFEAGAQALSREFARLHHGGHKPGAFFIFQLGCDDDNIKLFSLIKYDYQEVIEQAEGDEGNLLRRILQAFVAERRAIQKSAIIRVVGGVVEDAISALDRMKQAPAIGDYFASYLDVRRERSDDELTQAVKDVVRQALSESRDILPDRNLPRAIQRAQAVLRDRLQIDEIAVQEAILVAAGNPEDEQVRSQLQTRTRRKLRTAKLEGLTFQPSARVLQRPPIRQVKTTEGVTLIYPDDAAEGTVRRVDTPGGGQVITITTQHVTEDRVVRDNPRRLD
ncbi:hypothetical protein [Acetobacter fabarum]|uniref:hypothetical protein n=1 Tax=Acetobacter fabarum TaxID=483199 RepID=UPI0039E9967A